MALSARTDGFRLSKDLAELGLCGAGRKSITRLAFSQQEIAARRLASTWGQEIGASTAVDEAGNFFLRFPGRDQTLPPVLLGSSINTLHYETDLSRAYGFVAGLAALRTIAESGCQPRRGIHLVAWQNGEASRFKPGNMGLNLFAGKLQLSEVLASAATDGVTVREALETLLQQEKDYERLPIGYPISAYLEVQAMVFRTTNQQPPEETAIGVIPGISGSCTWHVEILEAPASLGDEGNPRRLSAKSCSQPIKRALERASEGGNGGIQTWVTIPNTPPSGHGCIDQDRAMALYRASSKQIDNGRQSKPEFPPSVHGWISKSSNDSKWLDNFNAKISEVCSAANNRCVVKLTPINSYPPRHFPDLIREQIRLAAEFREFPLVEMEMSSFNYPPHYFSRSGILAVPLRGRGLRYITPMDAAAGAQVLADIAWDLAEEL
jgi:N-carbamoyl-L-amino-acid hydrolase